MEEQEDVLRRRAEKHVRDLRGFYGHLAVYLAVMVILVIVDLADGSSGDTILGLDWAYWPIVGWGVFVVINGITVIGFGRRWESRKIEQYMERERDLQHH